MISMLTWRRALKRYATSFGKMGGRFGSLTEGHLFVILREAANKVLFFRGQAFTPPPYKKKSASLH